MNLAEDVDLEEFVTTKDDLSGADIKAVCTEAGLLALRERRMRVTKADFTSAREKVCLTPSRGVQPEPQLTFVWSINRSCIGRTRARRKDSTSDLYMFAFARILSFS